MKKENKIKQIVKKHYGEIAGGGSRCGCSNQTDNEKIAKSIGYSDEEIKSAGVANLGLGCGNPTGMGELEALRLCDLKDLEQEEAAKRMKVSQSTLQRILTSARKNVAEALVEGKAIKIRKD